MEDLTPPPFVSSSNVAIAPGVSARPDDLRLHFARSGGPGGQNVNKVNSKAELRIRPEELIGMTGAAVFRLKTANANRMTVDGDLLIVADAERSQFANRIACMEKLRAMVEAAVKEPKIRRKTRPSAGSREKRLDSKKAHSRIKAQRRSSDY
ncbi:MAG: alternative ribosome rescue aminoacyl-tRNA hydrolase ArfB [Planctomycetota bacterium]